MEKSNEDAPPAKVQKISDFFCPSKDESLGAVIARLTALDGLPFSLFVTSTELRKSLTARGFEMPKSRETIKSMFMTFYYKCKETTKQEIASIKSEGSKLSLIFDEWTSSSSKRYINAIVKTKDKLWNIGLIRLVKSGTAEVCIKLVEERLDEFGISLTDDIAAFTTDGASTMIKIGKIITPKHQLCLAHGIHLAMVDIFYKKPTSKVNIEEEQSASDDEDDLDGLDISLNGITMDITNAFGIKAIIEKVRKISKIFRKSPKKNDILQKYVKEDRGTELKLLIDCKTRWNTLFIMCKRFSDLELPIKKALIDIKSAPFTDEEFRMLSQITSVMNPVKVTVEALCRSDMDLCKADAALSFMLKELSSIKCPLSEELYKSLRKRIQERRTIYSTVINFLKNPSLKSEFDEDVSFHRIKKEIIDLVSRFKETNILDDSSGDESPNEDKNLSIEKKLKDAIGKCISPKKSDVVTGLEYNVPREIEIFKNGGVRGPHIQAAYNYLLTIPPTSVDCERCFSSAAYVNNKIRSRLSDETLDALIFLRSYLKQ